MGATIRTRRSFLKTALEYHRVGLRVIPVNDQKRPTVGEWQPYQQSQSEDQVREIFRKPCWGIAMITGFGVEVLDIDCKYWLEQSDLLAKFNDRNEALFPGKCPTRSLCIERSMNGGYHLIYRCSQSEGNQKLANRRPTVDELIIGDKTEKILFETRGERGYAVVAPSPGYTLLGGSSLLSIPEISPEQRSALFEVARSFDELSKLEAPQKNTHGRQEINTRGLTPWDAYNEANEAIDLLLEDGWTEHQSKGQKILLTRPGSSKNPYHGNYHRTFRTFTSWSNSVSEFEEGKTYRAYDVFRILKHNGDFKEAAKAARKMGYGDPFAKGVKQKAIQELSIDYIQPESVLKYEEQVSQSTFSRYLTSHFGEDQAFDLLESYLIGASDDGKPIFFQVDKQGRVREARGIEWDQQSGMNSEMPFKEIGSALTNKSAPNFKQCFFGEHLLSIFPEKPVAIVERESDAVIMAGLSPDVLWLAIAGASWTDRAVYKALERREVVLYPNIGNTYDWQEQSKILNTVCRVSVSNLLISRVDPEEVPSEYSIADYLLDTASQQTVPNQSETLNCLRNYYLYERPAIPDSLTVDGGKISDLHRTILKQFEIAETSKDEQEIHTAIQELELIKQAYEKALKEIPW